jgi:galactose mutarotase-like enzyme
MVGTETIQLGRQGTSLEISVDTRGARISSIRHTATNTELLLRTPWADEDLDGTFPSSRSSEQWHRQYAGGWDTLVPHFGAARTLDGVEHPYHGEAAWRVWRPSDQAEQHCELAVQLRTAPLALSRKIEVRDNQVLVTQTVRNLSSDPFSFTWAEHPAFGSALVDSSTVVQIGGKDVDLTFPAPGGSHKAFRCVDTLGVGNYSVTNRSSGLGVTMAWDATIFPFVYAWQEHRNSPQFPWWRMVDTFALEPASRPFEPPLDSLGPLVVEGLSEIETALTLSVTLSPSDS